MQSHGTLEITTTCNKLTFYAKHKKGRIDSEKNEEVNEKEFGL